MLLCGQAVSIGGRNHTVSHAKYLPHQTSPGYIYVTSGKYKVHLFIIMQRNGMVINRNTHCS